jgi:hypothetical protein
MNEVLLSVYGIFVGGPTVMLFFLGRRYGRSARAHWHGAFWRAVAWSIPTCWSFAVLGGRHGLPAALIPLPSWVLLPFVLLLDSRSLEAVPHPLISLTLPLLAFFVGAQSAHEGALPSAPPGEAEVHSASTPRVWWPAPDEAPRVQATSLSSTTQVGDHEVGHDGRTWRCARCQGAAKQVLDFREVPCPGDGNP